MTVEAKLALWAFPFRREAVAAGRPIRWMPLKMKVQREALRAFFSRPRCDHYLVHGIIRVIAHRLEISAWSTRQKSRGPRQRKRQRTIRIHWAGLPVSLSIASGELQSLYSWLEAAGEEHWSQVRNSLAIEILIALFPPELKEWALAGRPRGTSSDSHRVVRFARSALWFAEGLVRRAVNGDDSIRARIAAVLDGEDFPPSAAPSDQKRIAVKVMVRSLAPIQIGTTDSAEVEEPSRVFSRLLDRSARRRLESFHFRDQTTLAWPERLLGDQGQVARDFGLL